MATEGRNCVTTCWWKPNYAESYLNREILLGLMGDMQGCFADLKKESG